MLCYKPNKEKHCETVRKSIYTDTSKKAGTIVYKVDDHEPNRTLFIKSNSVKLRELDWWTKKSLSLCSKPWWLLDSIHKMSQYKINNGRGSCICFKVNARTNFKDKIDLKKIYFWKVDSLKNTKEMWFLCYLPFNVFICIYVYICMCVCAYVQYT